MSLARLAALILTTAGWPMLAYASPCGVCDTAAPTCAANEVCIAGLEPTGTGRCVASCPNPTAAHGGCQADFTCVPFQDGSRRCIPRSDDCTNPTNYVETQIGQSCQTNSCVAASLCLDNVCTATCNVFGGGGCPGGQFCGAIGSPTAPFFICGHAVGEAEICNLGDLCSAGFCLNDGTSTQCYRNCGVGPGAMSCRSGQTCDNIPLQSGDSLDLCMPPMPGGVVPQPDAGPPDVGFVFPDAFVPSNPDAFVPSNPDAFVPSNPDASMQTNDDARPLQPGEDARPASDDASAPGPGADAGPAEQRDASAVIPRGNGGGTLRRTGGCATTDSTTPLALFGVLFLMLRRRRA